MDPAAALANRVLDRQSWAQQRLAQHAGRCFLVAVGPLATLLAIEPSGRLAAQPLAGSTPDLTLTLSPLALPAFLAQPARWDALVTASGDAALAATLRELAQTLPWFVEETFATVLGPIVGQRAADAGRALLAFPEHAAERVGESLGSYARDEAGLAARGSALQDFARDTAALGERVDALEARIAAIATRLAAPGGR
jgi:ubiquinone biosynthesis protein UbiJ